MRDFGGLSASVLEEAVRSIIEQLPSLMDEGMKRGAFSIPVYIPPIGPEGKIVMGNGKGWYLRKLGSKSGYFQPLDEWLEKKGATGRLFQIQGDVSMWGDECKIQRIPALQKESSVKCFRILTIDILSL